MDMKDLNLEPSSVSAISDRIREMEAGGARILKMLAGEPDFATPPPIMDAAIEAMRAGHTGYTAAAGVAELREALAEKLVSKNHVKTSKKQMVVSPGARYSIFLALSCLAGKGDEVLTLAPFWNGYSGIVEALGAKLVSAPEDTLEAAVTPRTRAIIVSSPNNPSGEVYTRAKLEALAEIARRRDLWIISDEVYEGLIYTAVPHISVASLSDDAQTRTVTVNGFSKAYAMTGWRLGYLSAPAEMAEKIIAIQGFLTHAPTSFAQYGALAAVQGAADKEVAAMRDEFARRREIICGLLDKIPGLSYAKPEGAFYVLCDIGRFGFSPKDFCARLLAEQNLAVIPASDFGAPRGIRLSYACSEENIRAALAALGAFCNSLKV